MGIGLSIVFTGLCALVTDGDRRAGAGASGGRTGHRRGRRRRASRARAHARREPGEPCQRRDEPADASRGGLAGRPTPRGAFASDGLTAAEQLGLWDLTGSEVRIRVQRDTETAGLRLSMPPAGASSWPAPPRDANDPAAWRDVRFLADMKALAGDGRIDPSLVDETRQRRAAFRSAVAARIHLDAGLVEAGIPSQTLTATTSSSSGAPSEPPKLRQALTDTMRWSLEHGRGAIVVDRDRPRDGASPVEAARAHADVRRATELFVSNLPAENGVSRRSSRGDERRDGGAPLRRLLQAARRPPRRTGRCRGWAPPRRARGSRNDGHDLLPPGAFTRQLAHEGCKSVEAQMRRPWQDRADRSRGARRRAQPSVAKPARSGH